MASSANSSRVSLQFIQCPKVSLLGFVNMTLTQKKSKGFPTHEYKMCMHMSVMCTQVSDFVSQFTEERLGQAEKTELDPHLENLITRADGTKNWTEKILRQTEVLLQPNPSKKMMSRHQVM